MDKNNDGQVTLTCDAKKISHVIIGSFDKSVSYQLTATYIEKITVPQYVINNDNSASKIFCAKSLSA